MTVREIARLQGFADDFVFYDTDPYAQVLAALPPPVAMLIGQTILRTIYEYRLVCGDKNPNATGANGLSAKRPVAEAVRTSGSSGGVSSSKRSRVEVVRPPSTPLHSGQRKQKGSSFTSAENHHTLDPRVLGVGSPRPVGTALRKPRKTTGPATYREPQYDTESD